MKSIFGILFFQLLFANNIFSQSFFQKNRLIETGVYYYPEYWSPDQWDRDLENIAKSGYEFTHFAEFSWAMIEPTDGKFDFGWLDKALALAHKHGLKVIMCTPSPTPPRWLTHKYPEVLVVRDNGVAASHGTRQHCSWSSPKYRQLVKRVVEKMALRYGNDARVWGWQIDNEPSHYGVVDYGKSVEKNFRVWLQQKYNSIDSLNKVWAGGFWSNKYNDFKQIELPNPLRLISSPASPHSLLDFRRFSAQECASFVSMQAEILRKHVDKSQFITTNFMHEHDPVDPWLNKDLDFTTYTAYPVSGNLAGTGADGYRMGDWWRISWANDYFRSINGTTAVMEMQPGQVNWGAATPLPMPGVAYAWLWNAFVGDAKFVCAYRYRQPLTGAEQYYSGIVGPDGLTETSGGVEFRQFLTDMKKVRKQYNPDIKNPTDYEQRRVGFMFSLDNMWDQQIQPQNAKWSYLLHQYQMYANLKSLNCPVDFIDSTSSFDKYKTIVAPSYQLVSKALYKKWEQFVRNGGNLILTARSGQKDHNGNYYETTWAGNLSTLIGCKIECFDNLPGDFVGNLTFDKQNYSWNRWADIISETNGAEVWARYADHFYKGKAAVTFHKIGKGTVTYIGASTSEGKLERNVLKKTFNAVNIPYVELPEAVVVDYRHGFGVAINYNSNTVQLPAGISSEFIIGSQTLNPAAVAVWQLK